MTRGLFWTVVIVAALLAGALGVFWADPVEQRVAHRVLPTGDAPTGGPIELPVSSRGGPLSLADYRGRYLWVYFGYTSCPDACPGSLAVISAALARLPPELQGKAAGLFISVDPERDTSERLREYVGYFHADIDGATGPDADLRGIAARYGVFYQHAELTSALGYVVDHSSATYLLGPDGALLAVHAHGTGSAELLQTLGRVAGWPDRAPSAEPPR